MKPQTAVTMNVIALFAIAGILIAAFAMQLALDELPCPLCLLQRALFCALAAGPILNLRYGPRTSHYALSILAALIGAAVSVRQVLLHILPGDPGYGTAVLGYHYYTWAFLMFVAAIALASLMLLFDRQFEDEAAPRASQAGAVAVWLVIGLVAANAFSTLAICGFAACPDNPVRYELLRP
ncbi:MAG: disulfide bond formation protein B [Pseudorhodoplanes sp.]